MVHSFPTRRSSDRHAGGGFRSLCNERFDLRACPVVDGHIMAGLQEVRRHAGAHVPQSDESDLHGNTFFLRLTPDALNLHRSAEPRADCECDAAADDDLDNGVGELAAREAVADEGDCEELAQTGALPASSSAASFGPTCITG